VAGVAVLARMNHLVLVVLVEQVAVVQAVAQATVL
jgi:hypothetical protein